MAKDDETSAKQATPSKVVSRGRSAAKSATFDIVPQLPLWSERARGYPNSLARSAFFTARPKNEPREYFKAHTPVVALQGYQISRKGEELRQDDADVFVQLVHIARDYPLAEGVPFTAYSFLKALGWGYDGDSYTRLRACLDRLQGHGVRVVAKDLGGFQGQMVRKFVWKDDAGEPLSRWMVWLEPEIVSLFGENAYTTIWWSQRMALTSPLAKFLHAYFATHEEPYPIKCETLRALCGSKTKRLTDFRKGLRTALQALVEVDFLDEWEIDSIDLVRVTRSPKKKFLEAPTKRGTGREVKEVA